jgi:hypothetical protein
MVKGSPACRPSWERFVTTQALWVWPPPAVIVAACRECAPRQPPPGEEEQRQRRAQALADAYVARYMKMSQVYKLAKRDGWLLDYVQSAAWVQAQLICQVRDISWDAGLARDLGDCSFSADTFAAYRTTVANPVGKGAIRVTVPAGRVREWQARCRLDEPETCQDGPRSSGPQ